MHKLLKCGCFQCTAVLQELLQLGSSSWGTALHKQAAPVWSSPGHSSCQGGSFLQGTSTCSQQRVLHGLQHGDLLQRSSLRGLQENLCSSTWSTSSPYFLTVVSAGLFLPLFFPSLISHNHCMLGFFYAFLYVTTEVPPALLMV